MLASDSLWGGTGAHTQGTAGRQATVPRREDGSDSCPSLGKLRVLGLSLLISDFSGRGISDGKRWVSKQICSDSKTLPEG